MKDIIYELKFFWLFLVVAFLFVVILQSPIKAQISNLDAGDRIKIYAPSIENSTIFGTIYELTSSAIYLHSSEHSLMVPYNSIERLELYMGEKRKTGRGALIGLTSGAFLLGTISVLTDDGCSGKDNCLVLSDSELFIIGAVIGGAVGLVVGTIAGYATKRERWKEIPLELSVGFKSTSFQNSISTPSFTFKVAFGY